MTVRELNHRLERAAKRAEVDLPSVLADALRAYYELLSRWNQKINLTSLKLEEMSDEAIDRLLVEPLIAARHIPIGTHAAIDFGSGGGSPAIPIKLARPELRLVMVEAKVRKCAFLREAIRTLNLSDTLVETARFEDLLPRPELHEAFDVGLMRAVRVEGKVLRTVQAFLRFGGELFLFRGPSGHLPDPLAPLQWRHTVPLTEPGRGRLIILEKTAVPA